MTSSQKTPDETKLINKVTAESIEKAIQQAKSQTAQEFEELIEIERDCIKSGNTLTPHEQDKCCETLNNLLRRLGKSEAQIAKLEKDVKK